MKCLFTDSLMRTLETFRVVVSEFEETNTFWKCVDYDGAINSTPIITVTCKAIARYVNIKRNPGYKYEYMAICEVVIIGHLLVCKYYTVYSWLCQNK